MADLPDSLRNNDYDLWGAAVQGLIGGLANGTAAGAVGTALRDLLVQATASDTASALKDPELRGQSDRPTPQQ